MERVRRKGELLPVSSRPYAPVPDGGATEPLGLLVALGLIPFVVGVFVGPCPSY